MPGATPDFRTELAAQLAELIPEAIADGKVDIQKLKELLGDDAGPESERFGLFWPGKKRALRAAQAPTTATLKPDFASSKDWDTAQNVFIEGDNLEVLKVLQKHYHNKIKLIYIDPPYNTGKDFIYPDNYVEGLQTYLEWTKQVNEEGRKISSNSESQGRYHSNWLNMMYPRLKLARNLLTDDGVIIISIDDNEQDNLHKLCNEVFGENNFIGTIIWKSRVSEDTRSVNGLSTDHEYMVCYSKTNSTSLRGAEKDIEKFKNLDGDKRGPWRSADMTGLATKDKRPNLHYDLIDPKTGTNYGCPPKGWRFEPGTMARKISEKRILWPTGIDGRPRQKLFLGEMESIYKNFSSVIQEFSTGEGTKEVNALIGSGIFDFPKPTQLIKTFIEQATFADSIILDFFSGSSTSAHAAMALNAEDGGSRRFIMVQLPEPTPEESEARKAGFKTIADISRKRIELAGEKITADSPLTAQDVDTGFRAYKLTDTNFAKWHISSDIEPDKLEQRLLDLRDSASDSASADDLLAEILLKLGFSLTEKITKQNIAGLGVKQIGDNHVLAYLNEQIKPTLEQLRALVDAMPVRIIMLEDTFHGDDELKTNLSQYARSKGVELWTA